MRRIYLVSLLAVGLLGGAAACGGSQEPRPAPAAGATEGSDAPSSVGEQSSSAAAGVDLDTVETCDLLPASARGKLGIRDAVPQPEDFAGGKPCAMNGERFTLQLVAFPNGSLADFAATNSGPVTDTEVGPFPAKQNENQSGCKISIGVGESSRVDVFVTLGTDSAKACEQSSRAAELMLPQLTG